MYKLGRPGGYGRGWRPFTSSKANFSASARSLLAGAGPSFFPPHPHPGMLDPLPPNISDCFQQCLALLAFNAPIFLQILASSHTLINEIQC